MKRSFTDRVFGGVCGGLAVALRVNAWVLRALFALLAVASAGAFAALYLLLWWIVPQESLMADAEARSGLPVALALALVALTLLAWVGHRLGYLRAPTGVDVFYPLMLLVLSAVFMLRQIRTG